MRTMLHGVSIHCDDCAHARPVSEDWLGEVSSRIAPRDKGPRDLADLLALVPRLKCSACGSKDVFLRAVVDGQLVEFAPSVLARVCVECARPIPLARVAAMPDAVRCRRCQEAREAGLSVEREPVTTCRKCGAEMVWRFSRNRYFLGCSRFPGCWYTQSAPGAGESEGRNRAQRGR